MMLLEGNSNDIVQTMRRADTGAAITDAVLSCKVFDPHGSLIDTVSMAHSGEGEYRGATVVSLTVGVQYLFDVKASNYVFRRIARETAQEPEV